MVKLTRLKINQYRNVRPGTELHFDDGVNLVLGQNGSGKTTLLGLLSCVIGSDLSPLQNEPFDLEYDIVGGDFTASVHIEADPQRELLDDPESIRRAENPARDQPAFSYRFVISSEASSATCEITGTPEGTTVVESELPANLKIHPISPVRRGFFHEALDELVHTSRFSEPSLGFYVHLVARFDESLDAFLAMTGRPVVTASAGTPPTARLNVSHFPKRFTHATLRQFVPKSLFSLVPVAHESIAGEIRVSTADADSDSTEGPQIMSFLLNAAKAMGFTAAAMKPEIKATRTTVTARQFEVEGFTFNFTRRDGSTIHHDLLSYGQKRLLAYYYYLASTEHVVIADELVNGLHHRWIEACMAAIGERQAFLTSQNPLLFEYVRFESIEQVQRCFVTCKTEIVDGAEQLVWQNMPRPDAISFFESYKADIESVGDILITRGLW